MAILLFLLLLPKACKKEPVIPPGIHAWNGEDPHPLDWGEKSAELKQAFEAFNKAWAAQGGSPLKVKQVFRSADYTRHIRSVFEAYAMLEGKPNAAQGYNCSGVKPLYITAEQVANYSDAQKQWVLAEAKKHGFDIKESPTPPACRSSHEEGIALDIAPPAIKGPMYQKWIKIGESVGLCHDIAGDEPHFILRKYRNGRACGQL